MTAANGGAPKKTDGLEACVEALLFLSSDPVSSDDLAKAIDAWEDDLFLIEEGELDYRKIIEEHMGRLDAKLASVEEYLKAAKEGT